MSSKLLWAAEVQENSPLSLAHSRIGATNPGRNVEYQDTNPRKDCKDTASDGDGALRTASRCSWSGKIPLASITWPKNTEKSVWNCISSHLTLALIHSVFAEQYWDSNCVPQPFLRTQWDHPGSFWCREPPLGWWPSFSGNSAKFEQAVVSNKSCNIPTLFLQGKLIVSIS